MPGGKTRAPGGKTRLMNRWKLYMGVSKNMGKPPQIIHFNRVFHYFHHPFWGTTIFGNTHIYLCSMKESCIIIVDLYIIYHNIISWNHYMARIIKII